MREIYGGYQMNSDCVFHCLAYLMCQANNTAGTSEPQLTYENYLNLMETAYYNDYPGYRTGVDSANINSFVRRYYDTVSIDYKRDGFSGIYRAMSEGAGVIMTIPANGVSVDPSNPKYHAVILNGASTRVGNNGQVTHMVYNYYDPQNQCTGSIIVELAKEQELKDEYGKQYNTVGFIDPIKLH
jgi:hypothetical protein